jgi:hypothetical protein
MRHWIRIGREMQSSWNEPISRKSKGKASGLDFETPLSFLEDGNSGFMTQFIINVNIRHVRVLQSMFWYFTYYKIFKLWGYFYKSEKLTFN